MTYVQALTGGGGWPMSVWLTPHLQPIYGATYLPPVDRPGMPSFATVLRRITLPLVLPGLVGTIHPGQ